MTRDNWQHDPTLANEFSSYDDSIEQQVVYKPLIAELSATMQAPQKILDFGCGDGHLVAALRASGLDAWGADVSTTMINRAVDRDIQVTKLALLTDDSLARSKHPLAGRFDAVVCCFVLETLPSEKAIGEAVRALAASTRSAAQLIIVHFNADATGVVFPTFTAGETGRTYQPGDALHVSMRHEQDIERIEFNDTYWPNSALLNAVELAGFTSLTATRLTISGYSLAPFIRIDATKGA